VKVDWPVALFWAGYLAILAVIFWLVAERV